MRGQAVLAVSIAVASVACSGQELAPGWLHATDRLRAALAPAQSEIERLRASVRSLQALAEVSTARLAPAAAWPRAPTALPPARSSPSGESDEQPASVEPQPSHEPGQWLGALAKEVVVFAEPSARARRLGYLRMGARVRRSQDPVSRQGCRGGWYRVAPEGFVCASSHATLDLDHPVLQLALAEPSRDDGLPYAYGRSRSPAPPIYRSVSAEAEGGPARLGPWQGVALQPVPELLRAATGAAPNKQQSVARSAFAFVSFVEAGGLGYGVTTDLTLVPLGGVTPVAPSRLHGLVLDDTLTLPVAFVKHATAWLYRGDATRGLTPERKLERRQAVPLGEGRLRSGGSVWLQTRTGEWLREAAVRVVTRRPEAGLPGGKWIDVSIEQQTLVAYEGDKPVFVTLVSTGLDGMGDPATTRATVRGRYRIHTKHVTATMDSDEAGDEYDLRDVPYVQYFTQGYALHAAYWHDAFGTPKSHGCVNLTPSDARFLFHWTDPPVPQGWHAALSLHQGTLIEIRP